ncbi:MAG: YSC84-related protein [Phycisphaeraceae bacterium]
MTRFIAPLALACTAAVFTGCAAPQATDSNVDALAALADQAKADFIAEDPAMADRFSSSVGYAIFPSVAKGLGFGFSGARGEGIVYKGGAPVALSTLGQGGIGFGLGGLTYQQVLFFNTNEAFDSFAAEKFAFTAQAGAVAGIYGASVDADVLKDVTIFTNENGGLMYEAGIGMAGYRHNLID